MSTFALYALADVLAGAVLAAVAALVAIRTPSPLRRGDRAVAAVLPTLALLVLCAAEAWLAFPFWLPESGTSEHFLRMVRLAHTALPLALGFVLVLGLAWPGRRPAPSGVAELAPRGVTTYVRPRWAVAGGVVLAIILAATIAAGVASQPDAEGRFTEYRVDVGAGSVGTTIYGWFFSVPSLVLLAALVLATVAALAVIARPPLGADVEAESARRRARTRDVLAAALGAMLLHLGTVLGSLGGTAALAGRFQAGDLGLITIGTPFAAIGPVLAWSGFAASVLGAALWCVIPLSTIRIGARA